MEGPYRDLGSGFARLTGIEGLRRGPSHINYVEDALLELLRNARDAGAENIYVATSLRARRYRSLTVIDDGHGIPASHKDLVFEPGVTSRHLHPIPSSQTTNGPTNAGGLSLYHIKNAAVEAEVFSTKDPTSIRTTFDTRFLPERALQSGTRSSHSNLLGTARSFLSNPISTTNPTVYYGSPATIIATLIKNHIIQKRSNEASQVVGEGERLGLSISLRTVQRINRGEIEPTSAVVARNTDLGGKDGNRETPENATSQAMFQLDQEERSGIAAILGEAARTRYLEVGELEVESRPGEIVIKSLVYEPEEEYE